MRSRFPLVFGAGTIGRPGPNSNGARIHTAEDAQAVVNRYVELGYNTIDTARLYGGGTSEEILGQMDLGNCVVDTKSHGYFTEQGIRESLNRSLAALGKHKIRTLYLHALDPMVPITTTLRAVDALYNEGHLACTAGHGHLKQVAEAVVIASEHGLIKPTVYQGAYNAIERTVEAELLPSLRHFGIKFYAVSLLAGGVLAGNVRNEEKMATRKGGRWDPESCRFASSIRSRYAPMLPAVEELREALDRQRLGLTEASLRWMQHHSALEEGDAVILGTPTVKQLETNINHSEGGPLPEDVVELFESAWLGVKPFARHYAS